jgi:hypothetical protein
MKLSSASLEQTREQISAQPLPDDHPIVPQLTNYYGNHTFFLDDEGLLIIEPAEPTRAGVPCGRLVKLASWKKGEHNTVAPHLPEETDVVVELAHDAPLD